MLHDGVVGVDARGLPELDQGHEHGPRDVPSVGELAGDAFGLVLFVEDHQGVGDGGAGLCEGVYGHDG